MKSALPLILDQSEGVALRRTATSAGANGGQLGAKLDGVVGTADE